MGADLTSKQFLIGAGLLPNPDQYDGVLKASSRVDERGPSPLVPHYERTMHELADENDWLRDRLRENDRASKDAFAQAGRLHTAMRWLRDVYDFDDLTLRVIAHVLDEADDDDRDRGEDD